MAVTRLADAAPVPVFVARGLGAHHGVARLWADPGVEVVRSPRHATVLVVAGAIPIDHAGPLRRVHDQVPAPRGVATIGVAGDLRPLGFGDPTRLPEDDPAPALRELQHAVLAGRATSPTVGPDDNPVAWQGVGPHGQGGEGMMGGTPYGRMMPMPPTEGRDGLALDRLSLRLGPVLPGLPAGYALDVGLQGDVLEDAALAAPDLDGGVVGDAGPPADDATRLLVALVELTAAAGLDALARRVAGVALAPTRDGVADLRRRLDRPWGLRAATDGVGTLPDGTDVTARWRRWLDRAAVAASGAGEARPWPAMDPADVSDALTGLELGRAMLTLLSLQPDLEVAAPTTVGAP